MYIEKSTGGNFQPTPPGNHVAVCYRFIDLGTQLVEYEGTSKTQRKVLVSWELPNEIMTEGEYAGQPFTIGKKYTWSMHEKATLRHDLESWRGRAFTDDDFDGPKRFNVKNVIGAACMLQIVHESKNGKNYSNIKAIAAMPKGLQAPTLTSKSVYFSLQPEFFDNATLDGLSDKLKETIKSSPEYKAIADSSYQSPANLAENGLDDEVPF
jgi:hypothetical protein